MTTAQRFRTGVVVAVVGVLLTGCASTATSSAAQFTPTPESTQHGTPTPGSTATMPPFATTNPDQANADRLLYDPNWTVDDMQKQAALDTQYAAQHTACSHLGVDSDIVDFFYRPYEADAGIADPNERCEYSSSGDDYTVPEQATLSIFIAPASNQSVDDLVHSKIGQLDKQSVAGLPGNTSLYEYTKVTNVPGQPVAISFGDVYIYSGQDLVFYITIFGTRFGTDKVPTDFIRQRMAEIGNKLNDERSALAGFAGGGD